MNHTRPNFSSSIIRRRILVNGIVQGVGFRPYVYTLAHELALSGFISNSVNGVEIELEGSAQNLDKFKNRLLRHPPPLAEISEWSEVEIPVKQSMDFKIHISKAGAGNQTLISPDMSVCSDCLRELFDPDDRRYLYPFINCTNCGPRFTIIKGVPYDRPLTTMAQFELCPACKTEYEDPANRRFHAQPNACPDCGPQVWFEVPAEPDPVSKNNRSFDTAVRFLLEGKILAVKGLGGFHLVIDATNADAVRRLRERKNREQKPLALMLPDLETINKIAEVTDTEMGLLQSAQRPIVLLKRKNQNTVADDVAPGNQRLGIMLPYTPLHYILFERLKQNLDSDTLPALVFTSANRADEPIVIDNKEARNRLSDIADGFLMHNRDILVRADDSVLFTLNKEVQFIRRSRGYVPRPFILEQTSPPILAVGGELKNTICILKQNRAFLSQHIGDLENLTANRFFEETVANFQKILTVEPEYIVHDMHPGYFSSQWAKRQNGKKLFSVQHHHAHMASCMAENKLDEPVIGLILDGTGYGYDGAIWGGEVLVGHFTEIERRAWLEPMPLPGGEAAIKQPWRLAAGYLHQTFNGLLPNLSTLSGFSLPIISEIIEKKINTPYSSSAGRLFDAVAALSGGRSAIHYEGQAAIELMQSILSMQVEPFPFEIELPLIPVQPIIRALVDAIHNGQKFPVLAARFHKTLIELFTQIIQQISTDAGIRKVVLSGGVFQNEILLTGLSKRLQERQLEVFTQHQFPVNDGGIALGQAVIAKKLITAGLENVLFNSSDKS